MVAMGHCTTPMYVCVLVVLVCLQHAIITLQNQELLRHRVAYQLETTKYCYSFETRPAAVFVRVDLHKRILLKLLCITGFCSSKTPLTKIWAKHGPICLLIPGHDPPTDITIVMDILF